MSEPASLPETSSSAPARVKHRAGLMLAVLAVVVGSLIFPFPLEGRVWGEIFNLAHAPVFCVTLLFLVGLRDPSAVGLPSKFGSIVPIRFRLALTIAGGLMILGILCEYIQRFTARSPNLADILANSVGVLAALVWIHGCIRRPQASVIRRATLPVLLLIAVSIPALCQLVDSVQQMAAFPLIGSFERRFEVDGWDAHNAKIQATTAWASDGQRSLEVTMLPGKYPGVWLLWFEGDWTSYEFFELDLQNPEQRELTLIVKLHDRTHWSLNFPSDDRFHQTVRIPPGGEMAVRIPLEEVFSAPATRRMDGDQMSLIDIYAVDVTEPTTFRLDHVRLSGPQPADRDESEIE